MEETEPEMRVRDVVNAAATVAEAVHQAPDRALQAVETGLAGRADVVVDEQAVDVVLHDRNATVHIRRDGGS